jgi:hypothetical protein
MRNWWGLAVSIVAIGLGWLAHHYFSTTPSQTARMDCRFDLAADAPPARSAVSSIAVSRVDVAIRLTMRSVDDGMMLWHADGVAKFAGQSRPVSGVVFVREKGPVSGFSLWEERSADDEGKLRIATLNQDGKLDWSETVAYVRFTNAEDKRRHPFGYACKMLDGA